MKRTDNAFRAFRNRIARAFDTNKDCDDRQRVATAYYRNRFPDLDEESLLALSEGRVSDKLSSQGWLDLETKEATTRSDFGLSALAAGFEKLQERASNLTAEHLARGRAKGNACTVLVRDGIASG